MEIKSALQGYKFKSLTGARREMLMKEEAPCKTIGSGVDCGEPGNTIPICKGQCRQAPDISTKKSLYNGHHI